MRTKHLLIALALPLGFAACSQEEIVSNENLNDAANRRTVENVVLNFEGEAASRMIYNGDYTWEAGDQYGACLMDEITEYYRLSYANGAAKTWNDWFTIVDYIHTNYPFTKQSRGGWTSEAVMSEGNYFFYYPYNSNLGGQRKPIRLAMPQPVLEAGDKAMSVFDDQLFVGYSKIVADPEKEHDVVNVTMQPILGAVGFKMQNVGTTPITVRKVAFVREGGFPTYFDVKPAAKTGYTGFNSNNFYGYTSDVAKNQRNDVLNTVVPGGQSDKIAVVYDGGRVLEASKANSLTTYIMMPPATGMTGTKLHVYTNLGMLEVDLMSTHEEGSTAVNYTNDGVVKSVAYGDIETIYITFDNTSIKKLTAMNVSTTDELEDLVSWNAGIQTPTILTANLMQNSNVKLTKKVADILKNNDYLTLNFDYASGVSAATLTIPADAPAYTWDEINKIPADLSLVNYASLKLEKDLKHANELAYFENRGTVEFATATISAGSTSVYNLGTMNFTKKDQSLVTKGTGTSATGYWSLFENQGTINVKANMDVAQEGLLNNGGTINVISGTLKSKIWNKNRYNSTTESWATFVSEGIINVDGTWTAEGTSLGQNYATINVNGTLNVATGAKFVNNPLELKSGNTTKYTAKITNSGIIKGIENKGLVIIATTDATYEAIASSTGEVNNNIQNSYIVNNPSETIFVALTGETKSSELKDIVLKSNAEQVRIEGTLTLDPKDAGTHTIIGNNVVLNIKTTGNLDIKGEGTLIITGNVTSSTKYSNTVFTNISDAVVDIYPKVKIGVGSVVNNGTLKVQSGAALTGKKTTVGNTVIAGTWTDKAVQYMN